MKPLKKNRCKSYEVSFQSLCFFFLFISLIVLAECLFFYVSIE